MGVAVTNHGETAVSIISHVSDWQGEQHLLDVRSTQASYLYSLHHSSQLLWPWVAVLAYGHPRRSEVPCHPRCETASPLGRLWTSWDTRLTVHWLHITTKLTPSCFNCRVHDNETWTTPWLACRWTDHSIALVVQEVQSIMCLRPCVQTKTPDKNFWMQWRLT